MDRAEAGSTLGASRFAIVFRAAGYSPEEVEGYTKAVQERIAELNALWTSGKFQEAN